MLSRELLALLALIQGTQIVIAGKAVGYDSSYVFVEVRKAGSADATRLCANFQQFRTQQLPEYPENARPYSLAWWNDEVGETDVCKPNSRTFDGRIVPAEYAVERGNLSCNVPNRTARVIPYQVRQLQQYNASAALFLMTKGRTYKTWNYADSLFAQFYSPDLDDVQSPSVFYMYDDVFRKEVEAKYGADTNVELSFYRPATWFLDMSVGVLWFIAFFCVSVGSIWAAASVFNDRKTVRNLVSREALTVDAESGTTTSSAPASTETSGTSSSRTKKSKEETQKEIAQMSCCAHVIYVGVAVVIVVAVLLLAFFFRSYAVWFFNTMLVVLGTYCVHQCVYALLSLVLKDVQLFSLADLCCFCCASERTNPSSLTRTSSSSDAALPSSTDDLSPSAKPSCVQRLARSSFFQHKLRLVSMLVFAAALTLCLVWLVYRRKYYSFYLLDFINICLCVHAIKCSQILTFLLVAMFVYDIIMVFGTRLLTPSGCSVMLQVVTGVDCTATVKTGNDTRKYYPVAPVDIETPQVIPLLFYVPLLNDPMSECLDLDVEVEYKHIMLGLGDVIIPGYLIAYCFYVDVIKGMRHSYGIVSLIGYSTGMLATFLALKLMQTAQPALIYLVPFTLVPTYLWAWKNGHLGQMWRGSLEPESS
ncbi:signal peptide peptidase family protein [Aphelenchoides avenae]|nr:signal peptide peptidase family protein [Aphelenchus avenae]